MKKFAVLICLAALTAFTISAQTWNVDKAHAKLGFTVSHMMISEVEGSFKSFEAKITSSKDDFSDAAIELTAEVNSINTDNDRRDGHLKSADFFDVAKYPTLTFKSKSLKKVEGKKYKLSGFLTMHGVTKPIDLDVVFNGIAAGGANKKIAGFKVTGIVKRAEFGISPSTPDAALGTDVNLVANLEFIAENPPQVN